MRKSPLLVGFLIVTSLAACAQKGGPGKSGDGRPMIKRPIDNTEVMVFATFDKSGDYRLTMDEIQTGIGASFERADETGDGRLTQIEYSRWCARAMGNPYASPFFMGLDKDGNGTLTRTEYEQAFLALARSYDKDKDGAVTFAELKPTVSIPMTGASGRRSGMGRGQGRGRRGPPGGGGNWLEDVPV